MKEHIYERYFSFVDFIFFLKVALCTAEDK